MSSPYMKFCGMLSLFSHTRYNKEPKHNHQHNRSVVCVGSDFIHLMMSVYSSEVAS